jgi:hypothetical protein
MILGRFCCVFNKIPLRLCPIKISSFVMGKILTWILLNTQQNLPRINLVICWLWSLIIFMFHRYLFQPCLYPMKTVHLGILHIPTHGGVAGGACPPCGGIISMARGSGGKWAPKGKIVL